MASARINLGRVSRLFGLVLLASVTVSAPAARAQYPSAPQVKKDGTAVMLEDYASLPLSNPMKNGAYFTSIDYHEQLARVNSLRSEPADAPRSSSRFFVNDLNGILYILDKTTKNFTPYINLAEVFPGYSTASGYAGGIVSIAFDPAYAKNGKFYTVHTELIGKSESGVPTNAHLPNLNLNGYATTAAVIPPAGDVKWESVLVEWTDTDVKNSTFEGTAREVLRIGFNSNRHQMDDLVFNPLASPGSDDYRNLYISVGDGGAGETPGITHTIPQQLNALQGKILRITPDLTLRPKDMLSSNGRYRVPSTGSDANPFISVRGARPEIYAYGLRNPHRMTWDKVTKTFIANDIGLHSWEEVDIIVKGANYGYSEREGNEQVFVDQDGKTATQLSPAVPFPAEDRLKVEGITDLVTPRYPAAVYSHREGDSIGSGFVYRGKLMPQLRGKYIFNDITTGRIFYSDLGEMIASGGVRNKSAQIHELQIVYKSPNDKSRQDPAKLRMYDIVADAYSHKGGTPNQNNVLPGSAASTAANPMYRSGNLDPYGVAYGGGRADTRLAMGGDDEIYVLSKPDGMIRKLTGVVASAPASKKTAGH